MSSSVFPTGCAAAVAVVAVVAGAASWRNFCFCLTLTAGLVLRILSLPCLVTCLVSFVTFLICSVVAVVAVLRRRFRAGLARLDVPEVLVVAVSVVVGAGATGFVTTIFAVSVASSICLIGCVVAPIVVIAVVAEVIAGGFAAAATVVFVVSSICPISEPNVLFPTSFHSIRVE